MFRKKQETPFTCKISQNQIINLNNDVGSYSIQDLKIFSRNTNSIVIIEDYGWIIKGKLELMH